MTRTSTESRAAGRPFRRALGITVAVLVALCALFAGLGIAQGPKLSSARVDTARVVAQPGQELRLFANQNLATVTRSQVRVSPATDFTVSTSGEILAVQFPQRLRYSTRYTVTVSGVTSQYLAAPQTFRYSFTTENADLFFLRRADPARGGQDQIVETGVTGAAQRVVYSAPHIQEFARLDSALAIVTPQEGGGSTLSLVSTTNPSAVEPFALPGPGTVEHLRAQPQSALLGFVFTSLDRSAPDALDHVLMVVDLTGDHSVNPVLGLDGSPLGVQSWTFVGTDTSLVAQTPDGDVGVYDARKRALVKPLGRFARLEGATSDGLRVVVGDAVSSIALTIADGTQVRLPALPVAGQASFGGAVELLGTGDARVQQVAVPSSGAGRYANLIVYESGGSSRVLYRTKDDAGSFTGVSISPNGQYAAITLVPDVASSVSDGEPVLPMSTSVTTIFVDIASGQVVKSVAGFDESW